MAKWYCVTSIYGDNDDVISAITETRETSQKPANGLQIIDAKQVWVDWFESQDEAELFLEAMLAKDDEE